MKSVIETHDLCKSYHGHPVVDHLNLTVPEGCVYGFLGPNGAGKSTTMKMLLGLVHPTGGSVELLGHILNESNRIALLRQTGSLIESPSGYLHLTARENLAIVADLKEVERRDIDRVLDIVHLTKDAARKVGQYSLGMKQRLGIAMALLGSSKLLFEGSLQQLQKHSRGGILLRVLDVSKALAVLNEQGMQAAARTEEPDVVLLPPQDDAALAALVCALAERGAGVVGLTAQTKSLEDIFLSLTQTSGEVA